MQGVEDGREMEDVESPPAVRVDDSMDQRVPVDVDGPEAGVTRLADVADGPEVVGPEYRVGPHMCHLMSALMVILASLVRSAVVMLLLTRVPGETW
eukprot:4685877-Amphidinium_carterae.1